jgi:putative membrane protein
MIVFKSASVGTLFKYVGRPVVFLFILDAAIAAGYVFAGWTWLAQPSVPLSIFGGVIGVIAGFRNASAYARWWEARTIWGSIVNQSRNFAREVLSMVSTSEICRTAECEADTIRRKLVILQIAYVHALRNHLRGISPWKELAGLIPEGVEEYLRDRSNVPLAIQQYMAVLVADCYRRGWIDQVRWAYIDRTLSNLMECQGASERIKNTPMPRLYDLLIRRFIGLYCVLLPLGMVQSLRLLTPFGSTFVGLIFLALDRVGRDLENPFENLPQDVPLTAISRSIEINLKEMIGEKVVPEPLSPADGVLW